jgi:hypothetical protein
MEQLSQLDLNGRGDGGEGLALQLKAGRRILYVAVDRVTGGLYILKCTGKVPLD